WEGDTVTITETDSYDVAVQATVGGIAADTNFYMYVVLNDDSIGPFYRFQTSGHILLGEQVAFKINVPKVPLVVGDTLKVSVSCDQDNADCGFVMIVSR